MFFLLNGTWYADQNKAVQYATSQALNEAVRSTQGGREVSPSIILFCIHNLILIYHHLRRYIQDQIFGIKIQAS